ncbi:DUF859 family phage minor structural protein [Microbacterium sp. NPDC089696]|uniref:DUF859 family phage minor structural protein n=1 Tax=Microbacterium sp. NPDC089696 TaxID=3364199 RepID=UPI003813653B
MAVFEVEMTGPGPYIMRLTYEVQSIAGGVQVAATLEWYRSGSWGATSRNAAAQYKLDIGGSAKTGTRNFNAPAGGAIGPQWIESHAVPFSSGSSTYITASFVTGTGDAGTGTITTLTVPIATASKASFTEVAGPAITAFDAGHGITVHTNRQSTDFTHDITYEFGSATGTIGLGVGASVPWTPPLSMLNAIPNNAQAAGTVRTVTKSGGSVIGATVTGFVLRAPASATPTVLSCTYADQNADVASTVGKPVAGLSRLKITVAGEGVYSSTIAAAEATLLGSTVQTGGEVSVTQSGALPVTARVTDSRGRQGAWAGTLDVLPYTPPTVTSYQARRCNAAGALQDDGAYLRVDIAASVASLLNGTERNAITIRARTRANGAGVWTPRNVITGGLTHNGFFVISGGDIFGTTTSWDVRVEVADKFGVYVADTTVATAAVTLDLYGKNVGVGKIWERGALDVAGDIYQDGEKVIDASDVASTTDAGVIEIATQAEVDAGTDTVRAVTPATLKNRAGLPYVTVAGRGTSSASGAVTVTLPAGKFTQPPRVNITPGNHPNVLVERLAADPTTTSFQVQLFTMPGGSLVAANFDWIAVQMTAGSGSG